MRKASCNKNEGNLAETTERIEKELLLCAIGMAAEWRVV